MTFMSMLPIKSYYKSSAVWLWARLVDTSKEVRHLFVCHLPAKVFGTGVNLPAQAGVFRWRVTYRSMLWSNVSVRFWVLPSAICCNRIVQLAVQTNTVLNAFRNEFLWESAYDQQIGYSERSPMTVSLPNRHILNRAKPLYEGNFKSRLCF